MNQKLNIFCYGSVNSPCLFDGLHNINELINTANYQVSEDDFIIDTKL